MSFISDLVKLPFYFLIILIPLIGCLLVLTGYSQWAHKKIALRQKIFASIVSYLPLAGFLLLALAFYLNPFFYDSSPLLKTIFNIYGVYAMTIGLGLGNILSEFSPTITSTTIGTIVYLTLFLYLLTLPLSLPLLSVLLVYIKKYQPKLLIFNSFLINVLVFLGLFFLVFTLGVLTFLVFEPQLPL